MLMGRLTAWLEDARRWTRDVVTEQTAGPEREADRHRLIVNAAALDGLRIHASYDTPELRAAEAGVRRLQRLLQMLLSNVVSVQDRLASLRRERPDLLDQISPLLADIADWFDNPGDGKAALLERIAATEPSDEAIRKDHDALLLRSLCARLADLIKFWDEITGLHVAIGRGERISVREEPVSLHRDHLMAALSGASATVAILLCTGFWIASGWSHGYLAAMMAAVGCSLFATLDEPAQAAAKFMNLAIIAILIASVYLLFVLPAVTSFPLLVAVLAPVFIPLAAAMASPIHFPVALPVLLTTAATLELQNRYQIDFANFLNGGIAQVIGLGTAVVVLTLMRSLGADWTVRRLMNAVRRDLARLAAGDSSLDRRRFEGRMYDRLSGLVPRLALTSHRPERRNLMRDALAGLRIGLNLLAIRRDRELLPDSAAEIIDTVLVAVRRHFGGSGGGMTIDELRRELDDATSRLAALDTGAAGTQVLLSLFGIRHALVHFQRTS
jgi:uncharacterized membrane protein YccC